MPRFDRIKSDSADVLALQDNVADAVEPLLASVLAGAILTDTLTLSTTASIVAHKLGRRPVGWIVVSPSADARIYGSLVSGLEDKLLSLTASAATTCRLVVF